MSSTFVLAPVPAAARRHRANSRTTPPTNFVGRSRSGSNASCSISRTRSRSRRPSLRHAPSASFINFVDTPLDAKYIGAELLKSPATPSCEHVNAQLRALGYQAGFLRTANQSSRPIFRRIFSKSQPTTPHEIVHKEFHPVPPVPKVPVSTLPKAPNAKKPKQYSKTNVRPTMYAQEVQVDIFFNGGKAKDYIARAATKTNGMSADKAGGGREVGGYKDEKGMLWWDQDEQWEWAALLPKEDDSDASSNSHDESAWVDFESGFERRSSTSSAHSDKSVEILLDELEELMSTIGAGTGADTDTNSCLEALPPRCVLTMPRSRARGAKGQGSTYLFPVELAQNSKNNKNTKNTKNTKHVLGPTTTTTTTTTSCRAKGAARRRRAGPPPPLTLAPPSPFGARMGAVVHGVGGPIASARHFKLAHSQGHSHGHGHSHSFDDSFVAREADLAWATLVSGSSSQRAPPQSAGLPKKAGKMAGLFKGFGNKARKQGMF
jgi:hypothetical protein